MEPVSERELTCVLFPGVVKNEEKAIQCLGGIKQISEVYSQPNKKMSLSFQPDNPFLKKLSGDVRKTAGVLFKVKVKKSQIGNEVRKEVISTSIVGRVHRIHRFESMFDFQYFPIETDASGNNKCMAEKIVPSGLEGCEFLNSHHEISPTYIIPPVFTRAEKPYNYAYTDKKCPEKGQEQEIDRDVSVIRKSRSTPVIRYTFNLTNELPTEPLDSVMERKNQRVVVYPQLEEEYQTIRQMFEERPIWSYNLLRFQTKYRLSSLKVILPCLAVYMNDGPWKLLWVKFGYDPRKNPESRIYQTFDFRVRDVGGMSTMVMSRGQTSQNKRADRVRQADASGSEYIATSDVDEAVVHFRPGMVPTQRQMYYMYCDVKVPEAEELLSAEPPAGMLCHESRGWLPPGADRLLRDVVSRYMRDTLLAGGRADTFNIVQGNSDEEMGFNSDEDVNMSTNEDQC